jgi:hypothetical protein
MLNTAAAFLVLLAKHKQFSAHVRVSHGARVAFVEVDAYFAGLLLLKFWPELQVDVLVSRQEGDTECDGCISV